MIGKITSATDKAKFVQLSATTKGVIELPTTWDTHPSFTIQVPRDNGDGLHKSYLYNFPGNYDIGLLCQVQAYGSAGKLKELIRLAEGILEIVEMSALAITVNPGFILEGNLLKLGFTKEVEDENPHSGNMIRFFIKEI